MRIHLSTFTRRTKLFVATGIVLAGTSSVLAFNNFDNSAADMMSPTEVKVNDHEDRITKAEADIADTKGRVEQVEQKTEDNTQAIAQTNQRVTVVERQVETVREQTTAEQRSAPAPAPAPVPVKTLNPRLVTAVVVEQKTDRLGGDAGWSCTYTLEGGKSFHTFQGYACHAVGTEISSDLATLWSIW